MFLNVIQGMINRYFRREYLEIYTSSWFTWNHRRQGAFLCCVLQIHYEIRLQNILKATTNFFRLQVKQQLSIILPTILAGCGPGLLYNVLGANTMCNGSSASLVQTARAWLNSSRLIAPRWES